MHFIILFGKFWPPYMVKATAAARAALPSPSTPASACWVFSYLRCSPPDCDMDYRVFNLQSVKSSSLKQTMNDMKGHNYGSSHQWSSLTSFQVSD